MDKSRNPVAVRATGDLARRMLLPSLYGLDADGLLPEDLRIVGTARTELSDADFRQRAQKDIAAISSWRLLPGPEIAQRFLDRLSDVAVDAYRPWKIFRKCGCGCRRLRSRRGNLLSTCSILVQEPTFDGLASVEPHLRDGQDGA
jgi:glucose-6-phosphate 1-dehydrogenase